MRYVAILLLIFSLFYTVLCQETAPDSARVYPLNEFVVTATRSTILVKDSPSQVDILNATEISNCNGNTVADLLKYSGMVYINDRGGNAGLKTASIRGSASEQLLVLINGNRFNSLQNGVAYLNLISLDNINQIEIVHGGNSALYGADALGGVINIITRQPLSIFRARTEASLGSFGFQKSLLEGQIRFNQVGIMTGFAVERGQDDFIYHTRTTTLEDATRNRQNADFSRRQLYLQSNFIPDKKSSINFSTQYNLSGFGVPGSLDWLTPLARQSDKDLICSASYNDSHFTGVEFSLKAGFHYNLENNIDPNPIYSYDSYYKNIFTNLNPELVLTLSEHQKMIFGCEFAQGKLISNEFDSEITRVQRSVYLSSESQFDYDRTVLNRLSLYQTIRYDYISDVDYAITPKVGMNIRLINDGDIRFRASFGRNFRSPSFNDLYYRFFGNPNLKPEHSISFDAGISSGFVFEGEHTIEATYFHLNTENRIVPNPLTYIPENIAKTISNGFEAKYEGIFFDNVIKIGFDYTLTDARKKNFDYPNDSTYDRKLVYVPSNIFNATISLHYSPIVLNMTYGIIGRRFIRMDNLVSLPTYRVTNLNVIIRESFWKMKGSIKCEINNLFDTDYRVFQNYPMPGRNYRVVIGVEY